MHTRIGIVTANLPFCADLSTDSGHFMSKDGQIGDLYEQKFDVTVNIFGPCNEIDD